ncbi:MULTISPECIES: hypothetical protein [unclassified Streptomyces]|uniref:hypothetical protein n=1 Tax=unclassified Streptomyces TaxID=2593676 RepID=UPI00224F05A6|nr:MULTISPECIES: hypothetical protein [unclassified Streptomyces]MCX4527925.1 hypothetical protein [Streptomyces sp. NBC_01551]MCX4541478.1 hypothetical protein [Streptomyces sp. NBC_01565]
MTVDPAEPDTFQEQLRDTLDAETPEADAVEQDAELQPREDDPLTSLDGSEATDGDAFEQARVVPLDEDDYR